jgi:hypothetical protein
VIDLGGIVNTQAPGRPLEASRSPSLFAVLTGNALP